MTMHRFVTKVLLHLLITGTIFVALSAFCEMPATADSAESPPAPALNSQEGTDSPPTDLGASENVPLRELGRTEAQELLENVFEWEVKGPAGVFDELQIEKLLAPNVAVIQAGESPQAGNALEGEETSTVSQPTTTLLDSTLPLRAETVAGQQEAVDLSLEHSEDELQPANPLVEVNIPSELGNGIELPESGITIELEGAPEERAPSEIDQSVGFYPNVATDTDLAVAPTPTGVETLTQLRSVDSPLSQVFSLQLPQGDILEEKDGGAQVTHEGEIVLAVPPPTALDASGANVPVNLTISGDSLVVTAEPTENSVYPILMDPLFQSYEWYAKGTTAGIHFYQSEGWGEQEAHHGGFFQYGSSVPGTELQPTVAYATPGLYLASLTTLESGGEAYWQYTVPRYYTDPSVDEGRLPETFISKLTASDVDWKAESNYHSPYVYMGIWGPTTGWIAPYVHEGLKEHSVSNMAWTYTFENPNHATDVKTARLGMYSTETTSGPSWAYLYAGAASVELSEPATTIPKLSEVHGPSEWVNQTITPVNFKVEDAGLGTSAVTISGEGSSPPTWKATYGCTGVAEKPCPFRWSTSKSVEPAVLPQGEDSLKVVAEDPIGHVSTQEKEGKLLDAHALVKVDHTAPELSLSGTVTEQGTLGTKRPTYTVKWNATDGTTEHPQSGVAKVTVKVDKQVVKEEGTGCATKNCPLSNQWTLESGKYAAGQHTVEVVAKDGVGLETTKSVTIQLNPSPPSLSLSGTATEQGTLGTTRPRYKLTLSASSEAGLESGSATYQFNSAFGSSGTGNGQFGHPGSIAFNYANSEILVSDAWRGRVERFNENGEYLGQFGSFGTGNGQLNESAALAYENVHNNILIADTYNNRIEKFSKEGTYLSQFGSKGSAGGQLLDPQGIGVNESNGDIWVSDTGNNRIEEFSETGAFIFALGKEVNKTMVEAHGTEAQQNRCTAASGNTCQAAKAASGSGTFKEPKGLDVPVLSTNVWVADSGNNRIEELGKEGEVIRTFGSEGSGAGQIEHPAAITAEPAGNVFVADTGNNRIDEFSKEGSYVAQFGSKGSGSGQFGLSAPLGLGVSGSGKLWVSDPENHRVQKWIPTKLKSEISTEIKVDGTLVNSGSTSCAGTEKCPISKEWTLESSAYTPGKHTIIAKATDGLGNTISKTLTVEVQRDTIKPTLEASGSLFNAPMGWVEQEGYELEASASDSGYGVTSIVFKIDGAQVASTSQTCPEGGCSESLAKSLNMSAYSGGAHHAELIATDGAGNTSTKTWTINVDPEGHVSSAEATATLEAVEGTTEETPIASTEELLEPEQIEGGDDPGLHQTGSEIKSTGVPDTTSLTTSPSSGFTIESSAGATKITPSVSEGSSNIAVVESVAGVAANIATEADSVIRPEYNGVQTFQAIRSESSPTKYSWTVHLASGQSLHAISEAYAEVQYENGTVAFLITAEEAHDATGAKVPTSIEVSGGDVVTLNVDFHSGTFVYPITAGASWETSYEVPAHTEGPEDETEIKEREQRESEAKTKEAKEDLAVLERAQDSSVQGADIPAPTAPEGGSGEATESKLTPFVVEERHICSAFEILGVGGCELWKVTIAEGHEDQRPHYVRGKDWVEWFSGTPSNDLICGNSYSPLWVYVERTGCELNTTPSKVYKKEHRHLTVWTHARIVTNIPTDFDGGHVSATGYHAYLIFIWPNGFQELEAREYAHREVLEA